MRKVHTRISAAVLASMVAAAPTVALAHNHTEAAAAAKPHHTFDDIDSNKDGVISRAEFDAAHKAMPAKAKAGEHACGEGKCGAKPAAKKAGTAAEHACGEGKCGAAKSDKKG